MENNISNRMESARKRDRGRPNNEEIIARGSPEQIEITGDALPKLPAVQPMRCILCGRGMVPKILRTAPDRRTISCGLCGGKMTIIYNPNKPPMVSKI